MPRPSVKTLLAFVLSVVLVLPIATIGVAHVYENQLVRSTEELLITEAVVIGEVYRKQLDPERGQAMLPPFESPDAPRVHPIRPLLDIRTSPLLPAAERDEAAQSDQSHAIPELNALLERIKFRNLSAVRVLDKKGIVVASPEGVTGYSLAHLPEVEAALNGEYHPVLRKRFSSSPTPALGSLSRAATIRVSLAIPIYADPRAPVGKGARVLGAVYDLRTPLELSKSLWQLRHELFVPAALSLLITLGLALLLSAAIARPLGRLRSAAERIAEGDRGGALEVGALAPQEIRALASSVLRMRDQLEARADYIREFAANAAHELKTPLTSLRGAAELLLEDDGAMSREQAQRFLSNIHSDTLSMDVLVQRILLLARIESTTPARERIDLRAFLAGTIERYRRRGHELVLRYEAATELVEMSADQLDSLVTNLVDNAVRHGANKPVEISVSDGPRGKKLVVRDHGAKLPASHFERVFERFYTTERERGGTGLGLAIVKAIAEAHGGSVAVEPHDDGASFIVNLG